MTKYIDPSEVHYRIAGLTLVTARSACVQDFDYYDYEGFYTEKLFETRQEADDWLTVEKAKAYQTGQISDDRLGVGFYFNSFVPRLIEVAERQQKRIEELEG